MSLIQEGLEKGLISFDEEQKYITYTHQNTRRNYANPEELVQAETFLKLILTYGYNPKRVRQFVPVTMGSSIKEADVIVYSDDACLSPYIVVECKHQDVSEQEFKQAVEQAFSYAYALAGTVKFIWATKGNKEEFYRFDKEKNKRTTEADIPYFGESATKKYRYAKGGFYKDKLKGKLETIPCSDIQKVEESELTRIFKQAHDALWAGGELNPSQAFDELDKLIFCKIWDEKNTKKGEPYQFQIISEYQENENQSDDKTLHDLKTRVLALYDKGKQKDPEVFNKPLDLTPERIKTIVEYFQRLSFLETDLDSKGKAFETFLGAYFRGEFGQFFTPRNVVKFVVDVLPITNESYVLDTSCGSGGFLLHALDKVRRQADRQFDKNNSKEAVAHYTHWHEFAEKRLFGIEINDQISRVAKMNMILHDDGHTNVVTFDGLFQIAVLADKKKNVGFAEGSFDFVITNPPFGSVIKQAEKAYMQVDGTTAPYYDFALKEINWIDAKLKSKHALTGRENQSTEILFIEQIHKFLKVGGYAAIVLPDGVLTNSSLQYVRDGIEEKFRLVGVVSLPQTAFTHTGAGVKSSVAFLKKHAPETTALIRQKKQDLQDRVAMQRELAKTVANFEKEKKAALNALDKTAADLDDRKKAISEEFSDKIAAFKEELEERYQAEKQQALPDYPIFMAIAEFIGYDATGKTIPQNDLPEITAELKRFITAIEAGQDRFFQ